jgi:hypothetical protein
MTRRKLMLTGIVILLAQRSGINSAVAGVSYLDPVGGWRYTYQGNFGASIEGNPPGFGTSQDFMALDGTWQHNQSDRWDGHVPGDPISDPTDPPGAPETVEGGPNGWSPGGAGSFTEGNVNYIRVQDPGNPEAHGWLQGSGRQDTNRRVYFGHPLLADGPLANQLVLSGTGVTLSFRVRIPDSGPMDNIYAETDMDGTPGLDVIPWFQNAPHGRGFIIANNRGIINIAQNNPADNNDTMVAFGLVTSNDVAEFKAQGSGSLATGNDSGGLVMNNLAGDAPSDLIDSTSPGTLNKLDIPDAELNEWNEFWVTLANNGPAAGNIEVNVYRNGSTTPSTFQVTLAAPENSAYEAEDAPYLEFGISDNALYGSFDMDFLSYQIGVIAPVAAPAEDADFDNDSDVDGSDFLIWQRGLGMATGATNANGDADGNGAVNGQDLAIWKTKFAITSGVGAAGAIPEPSAWALAALLLPLLKRRQ